MNKNIWIDLDNSPHVPLFIPIIRELEGRGCSVTITARDFAQTVNLLKNTDLVYTVVGRHYGKNKFKKLLGLFIRALQLARFVNGKKIDLALNHGSRSQVLACKLLGIQVLVGADYEHTESYIFSRLSSKMWIPEGISVQGLRDFGVSEKKLIRYNGYKEELYLQYFRPDTSFKARYGIPENKILVTLRPPATQANYHNEESEQTLSELIKLLTSDPSVHTICTPRTEDQKKSLKSHQSANFHVLEGVIDGLNLVYHSDIVISGGGTMNREAALLGTPVYSIFAGKLGSLDACMEKTGMITFIRNSSDIAKIRLCKKENSDPTSRPAGKNLTKSLVDSFLSDLP